MFSGAGPGGPWPCLVCGWSGSLVRLWSGSLVCGWSGSLVRLWSGSLVCGRVSCPSVVRVSGLWLACGGVSGRVRLSDWSCLGGPGLWSVVAGSRRPRTLKKKVHGVFFYDRRRLRPLGGSGLPRDVAPDLAAAGGPGMGRRKLEKMRGRFLNCKMYLMSEFGSNSITHTSLRACRRLRLRFGT